MRWYGAPAVAADVADVVLFYTLAKYTDDYSNTHHVDGLDAPGARPALAALVVSTLVNGAVVHGLHGHARRAGGASRCARRVFSLAPGFSARPSKPVSHRPR
jgi:hypothetical protein